MNNFTPFPLHIPYSYTHSFRYMQHLEITFLRKCNVFTQHHNNSLISSIGDIFEILKWVIHIIILFLTFKKRFELEGVSKKKSEFITCIFISIFIALNYYNFKILRISSNFECKPDRLYLLQRPLHIRQTLEDIWCYTWIH